VDGEDLDPLFPLGKLGRLRVLGPKAEPLQEGLEVGEALHGREEKQGVQVDPGPGGKPLQKGLVPGEALQGLQRGKVGQGAEGRELGPHRLREEGDGVLGLQGLLHLRKVQPHPGPPQEGQEGEALLGARGAFQEGKPQGVVEVPHLGPGEEAPPPPQGVGHAPGAEGGLQGREATPASHQDRHLRKGVALLPEGHKPVQKQVGLGPPLLLQPPFPHHPVHLHPAHLPPVGPHPHPLLPEEGGEAV
jgi:hypothetical protein